MKALFYTALFCLFLLPASSDAYSCSCNQSTQSASFKQSQVVMIGKFVRLTGDSVEFKAVKTWKGAKVDEIVSLNYLDFEGCDTDIELAEGKDYLLYAIPLEGAKETDKPTIVVDCGRSAPVEDAKEDIEKMDDVAAKAEKGL